jgi:hypothetical protein
LKVWRFRFCNFFLFNRTSKIGAAIETVSSMTGKNRTCFNFVSRVI